MTRDEALAIEAGGEEKTTPEKWMEAIMLLEAPYVQHGASAKRDEEVSGGPDVS